MNTIEIDPKFDETMQKLIVAANETVQEAMAIAGDDQPPLSAQWTWEPNVGGFPSARLTFRSGVDFASRSFKPKELSDDFLRDFHVTGVLGELYRLRLRRLRHEMADTPDDVAELV